MRALRPTLAGLAAALTIAVGAAPAAADGDDYLVEHRGWNGLSMLSGLARGLGFDVVSRARIEWDALGPGDVVLLLYPTERVEPNHVVAFIRNGGRVVVGDDFGRADETIERLAMLRRHGVGVGADTFYDELPYAPVARPLAPSHPLARGVEELTCNHPAVLTGVRGHTEVFGFGDGEAVVVSGSMGFGRFVVLSDPSVLINRMLEFEGNFRFAHNLLEFLGRDAGSGRLVVLTGDFRVTGEPTEIYADADSGASADQAMAGLNRWLEGLNDYFLTEWSLRILAVVIALLIAALAAYSLPFKSRIDISGSWTAARPEGEPADDFAGLVAEYDDGRRRSFELPAAVLRDNVAGHLADATGLDDPLDPALASELYRRLAERFGQDAAAAMRTLERTLKQLPTRAQAASPWQPVHISRRDFDRLVADCRRLYRTLGIEVHGS